MNMIMIVMMIVTVIVIMVVIMIMIVIINITIMIIKCMIKNTTAIDIRMSQWYCFCSANTVRNL